MFGGVPLLWRPSSAVRAWDRDEDRAALSQMLSLLVFVLLGMLGDP